MSDDMLAEYESSNSHFVEPFSEYGAIIEQSGIPVRVKDSGGQGSWLRVPQPVAGEEGEVLTVQPDLSIGWDPSTGGSGFLQRTATSISNATLKSTNAVTIVPAQGAGTVIVPVSWSLVYRYGGNNGFTTTQNFEIKYNGSSVLWTVAAINFAALMSQLLAQGATSNTGAVSVRTNSALDFKMAVALAGNAANDNTLDIEVVWYTISV